MVASGRKSLRSSQWATHKMGKTINIVGSYYHTEERTSEMIRAINTKKGNHKQICGLKVAYISFKAPVGSARFIGVVFEVAHFYHIWPYILQSLISSDLLASLCTHSYHK